jgi:hypothetical protein
MSPSEDRITRPTNPDDLVLEAWGQGLMVGSLLVMAAVTFANMKKHILLHKLIFAEVCLGDCLRFWSLLIFHKTVLYVLLTCWIQYSSSSP